MKPGDKVEVNMIWAANGPLEPLSRAWFKGYELVELYQNTIVVKHSSGIFANVNCIYPKACVRLEKA